MAAAPCPGRAGFGHHRLCRHRFAVSLEGVERTDGGRARRPRRHHRARQVAPQAARRKPTSGRDRRCGGLVAITTMAGRLADDHALEAFKAVGQSRAS